MRIRERPSMSNVTTPRPLRKQALRLLARRWGTQLAAMAADALCIVVGFVFAYQMRYEWDWPAPFNWVVREVQSQNYVAFDRFLLPAALLVGLLLALFVMKGLYRQPRTASLLDYASIIVGGATTGVAILIVLVFLWSSSQFYSRLIFAFALIAAVVLLTAWRGLVLGYQRWQWTRGVGRDRILVVGGSGLGRQVMEGIVAQPYLGYTLAGYLDDKPAPLSARPDGHFRHLGPIEQLGETLRREQIQQVILALPFWQHELLPNLVERCRADGVDFRLAPDLYELSFDRIDVANVGGTPLIGLKDVSLQGANLFVKRVIDLALVLLASPIILLFSALCAIAIRRDSDGPIVFEQTRVGKGGRQFTCYKFRTMVPNAEALKAELAGQNEADGPIFKIKNDPRLTRVGRWLRRTSLDELPQFWNVLKGDMSIVGPRPPTPAEVASYEPWHRRRLEVTPGLTGLWQVLGRSDTPFDEMVRLDIYYAENWSPAMDLRIILQTVPVVLTAKGAY
ncbi:MAG: sugar transferase [Roseiflexaceae bacterium]|nr:sugar transferase [Roseiflexaceae bacterium]